MRTRLPLRSTSVIASLLERDIVDYDEKLFEIESIGIKQRSRNSLEMSEVGWAEWSFSAGWWG